MYLMAGHKFYDIMDSDDVLLEAYTDVIRAIRFPDMDYTDAICYCQNLSDELLGNGRESTVASINILTTIEASKPYEEYWLDILGKVYELRPKIYHVSTSDARRRMANQLMMESDDRIDKAEKTMGLLARMDFDSYLEFDLMSQRTILGNRLGITPKLTGVFLSHFCNSFVSGETITIRYGPHPDLSTVMLITNIINSYL